MIKPLQYNPNVSFKGIEPEEKTPKAKAMPKDEKIDEFIADDETKIKNEDKSLENEVKPEDNKKEKRNLSDIPEEIQKHKKGFVNTVKRFNIATFTTLGAAKGVVCGTIAAGITGVIGKNIKDGKGQIVATGKGIIKDSLKGVKNALMFFPSLITKSPLENVKNLVTLPAKFYGKPYLNILNKANNGAKTHKATAFIATMVGLGVFAYKTVFGKVRANEKNAALDHKTRLGHVE